MRPDPRRFLEVAAAHLMTQTAPALGEGYQQQSTLVLGLMLTAVSEELERAAARRVAENGALRRIFSEAAPLVADAALRERLEAAAKGRDASLAVSALERANAELRALLIDLHAHVEELDSPGARALDAAIWRELAESTERRRLALGRF